MARCKHFDFHVCGTKCYMLQFYVQTNDQKPWSNQTFACSLVQDAINAYLTASCIDSYYILTSVI